MLAAVGAGAALSDPGRAQPATSPIEVVSVNTAGAPVADENVAPKVSDDGSVVVFDSAATSPSPPTPPGSPAPVQSAGVVTIRDREASTTVSAPDVPSLHPGVSGDGCVVAYSVPVVDQGTVELTALDRCGPVGGSLVGSAVVVDTVTASAALPAPALSADGSVIVWSTGRTIARYVETAAGYQESVITIPLTMFGTTAVVTGTGLDVSADGNSVAFVAGPGTTAFAPVPANVVSWSDRDGSGPFTAITELVSIGPTGGPATGESTSPSVSGDGRIVVFQSNSPDLAVAQATHPQSPFVAMFDRQGTGAVLAEDASRPTISTDGKSVVYDTSTDVHMKRWVGGASPFASVSDASLSIGIDGVSSAGPSVSGSVLSSDGNLVVFDSANGVALSADGRFATGSHVWARATVNPPPTSTTTTTTLPNPTSTIGGGATTTGPPATTVPPSTTPPPATTVPATTYPTNPNFPPPTAPTYRPPSGSGSSSSSGTGSRPSVGSGTTPFYSPVPIEAVAFVPAGVEFSPTIIEAGRQSTLMSLSNPTSALVAVSSLAFQGDPDGAFTVSDNGCEGVSVPPGGTCNITVNYAPVTIGSAQVSIVATLSNGSTVFGALTGTGAPAPIVTVVPGVASSGQVVAIQGSGFPAGITIELSWLGKEPAELVEVDEGGSFIETMIVMSHTPRGPGTATVVGQTDLFATVVGEVLITDTSDRSSSVLTQSAGSPFAS